MNSTIPKVFLSYAREDAEIAIYLSSALKDKGIDIWIDSNSLRIGDPFEAKIEGAIANSDFALVCLSSKSVNKTGFVQKEFRIILEASKTRPIEVPFALPIKLDRCEVPREFARYHWNELPADNRKGFIDKLAQDISEHYKNLMSRQNYLDEAVADKHTVNVNVTLLPIYTPNTEDQLVAILLDRSHPGTALGEKVKEWVSAYIKDSQFNLFQDYGTQRQILQDYIKKKLLEEIGLNFQIKLSLEGEELLKPIPLGPLQFSVRLKDYHLEQDLRMETGLRIETTLTIDEKNEINAILYQSSEQTQNIEGVLIQLIKEQTQKYFAENVTLERFCEDPEMDALLQDLIKVLNDALKNVGRKIEYISLKGILAAPSFFESQQDVAVSINHYPKQIILKSKVQLILQNKSAYRMAQSPSLDVWFEQMLTRIVHEVLFDVSYTDLLLRFQLLERQIKEKLKAAATEIGYDLKYQIIVPDLEPLEWLNNFTIIAEGAFETALANFPVKLNLAVIARIKGLKEIENYLNRQQDVPLLMKEAILSDTRQYLHTISPEQFYMRFFYTDNPKEKSVETSLVDLISKRLSDQFNAEVISIIPKIMETEVITRLRSLQEKTCPFEVEITPLHGGEIIFFKGNFDVEAIDQNGWDKVQSRNYTIDEIRRYLEGTLRARLKVLPENVLAYRNVNHLKELEAIISDLARKAIVEKFGLIIRVSTIQREHTELEMKQNELLLRKIEAMVNMTGSMSESGVAAGFELQKKRLDELERLFRLKAALFANNANEDEIGELDKRIAHMRVALLSDLDLTISTDIPLQLNPTAKKK